MISRAKVVAGKDMLARSREVGAGVWVSPINANSGMGGCGLCEKKAGCGNSLLLEPLLNKIGPIWVSTDQYTAPIPSMGQEVEIEINETSLLLGSALIYGLPLLGILFGLAMGALINSYFVGWAEDMSVLIGILLGLTSTFLAIRLITRSKTLIDKLQPRLSSTIIQSFMVYNPETDLSK